MDIPLAVDFIAVASYGDSTKSTGEVKLIKDLDESVTGQHVIIVEDIVDTGLTLNYLKNLLANRDPADIRICALLSKPARRLIDVTVDYLGFDIPDEFVIGYGLDYAEAIPQPALHRRPPAGRPVVPGRSTEGHRHEVSLLQPEWRQGGGLA